MIYRPAYLAAEEMHHVADKRGIPPVREYSSIVRIFNGIVVIGSLRDVHDAQLLNEWAGPRRTDTTKV